MVGGHIDRPIIIDPADGKIPPMTAEGQAEMRHSVGPQQDRTWVETAVARTRPSARDEPEAIFANAEQRPLSERCILGFGWTSGTPMLPNYIYNNGKQIVQTPDTVVIFAEMVHEARIVRLNSEHLPPRSAGGRGTRSVTGTATRWWSKPPTSRTKPDFYGSSEHLKVTERFRRENDNAILYRFTVEDPSTWERPWTGEYMWEKSDEPLYEYACHEGNYALVDILRGARHRDAEQATEGGGKTK